MLPGSSSLRHAAAWCTVVLGVAATLPGPLSGCTRAACGQGCDGADVCVDGTCRTPCNAEDDCPRRNHCDNGLCVVVEDGTSSSSSSSSPTSGATGGTSNATSASGSASSRPSGSSLPGGSSMGPSSAASASASTGSSSLNATSLAPSSSPATGSSSSLAAASSSSAAVSSSSQAGTSVGSSSGSGGSSASSLVGPSTSMPGLSSSLGLSSSSAAPPSSSALPSSSSCMPESAAQFCQRHNANCGLVLDVDNCGTSRNQVCGLCSGSDVCTPQRQCCTPETDQQLCTAAGAQCGPINVVDGCLQNRSVACGDCPGSANCTNNMCVASGWVFLGVGNSTFAGTMTSYVTIGVVPGTAVDLAIAVWAAEAEDLDVTGNQGNYTVTFQGSTACTRSDAPWSMVEGECFLRPTAASFLIQGNYPTAAISECAIRYDVNTRVVDFEDQSAAEDCAFAIFYRLP